jgi:hypothetical protein
MSGFLAQSSSYLVLHEKVDPNWMLLNGLAECVIEIWEINIMFIEDTLSHTNVNG